MTYLVDANVLSEPTKPIPNEKVVEWLRANERDLVVDPSSSASCASGYSRFLRDASGHDSNNGSRRWPGPSPAFPGTPRSAGGGRGWSSI